VWGLILFSTHRHFAPLQTRTLTFHNDIRTLLLSGKLQLIRHGRCFTEVRSRGDGGEEKKGSRTKVREAGKIRGERWEEKKGRKRMTKQRSGIRLKLGRVTTTKREYQSEELW